MQPIDILAISPHPDDAEIGCAGLLILAGNEGLKTAVVDLSEGEKSTRGDVHTRAEERELASRHLCLATRQSLKLPDTQIGTSPEHEQELISCIRQLRPRIVLAPYFHDRHPDHEAAAQMVKRACFFAKVREIGEGPAHRVDSLFHYCIHQPFEPSFVVDISSVWQRRQTCIAAYRSQFSSSISGPMGDDRPTELNDDSFLKALEARGRFYGAMINAEFGEPYFSTPPLAVNKASNLLKPTSGTTIYGSHF